MLFRTLLTAAVGASLIAMPADAKPGRDADRAFKAQREGRAMPLPMIRDRAKSSVREKVAVELSPELRGDTYRLKYILEDGRVIWVDVDAATGRVKRRSR